MVVPYDYLDFRKLIVVRTAESYLRSLWHHWNLHCEPLDFEAFAAKRREWRAECNAGAWFYWWDVEDYLADAPERRELVPLAKLNQTIRELTGVALPTLNRSRPQ